MKTLILAAAMTLTAMTASAQSLKLPTILYTGVVTADIVTTRWSQTDPTVHEGGKFSSYAFLDGHPNALMATMVGVDTATVLLVRKMGKNHPKLATITFYSLTALRTTAVINNIRVMRSAAPIPVCQQVFCRTY
jgi:hypothetical protein